MGSPVFNGIEFRRNRKGIRVKQVLADEHSQYQHIKVLETEFFGNTLILDGIIQLTERDNMGYHEMIVHVPMLAVGEPKRVLIVGGGDGGSLQQVLRYPSVEEAVICELDQRVVDLSREHFAATFGDPWEIRLHTAYPPGMNNYIKPEIHRAAFALPEFIRKEVYG